MYHIIENKTSFWKNILDKKIRQQVSLKPNFTALSTAIFFIF